MYMKDHPKRSAETVPYTYRGSPRSDPADARSRSCPSNGRVPMTKVSPHTQKLVIGKHKDSVLLEHFKMRSYAYLMP